MNSVTTEHALQLAAIHHEAGRLAEAEALYRQVLAAQPQNPDALHLLGALASQVGQHHASIDLISRAIALKPDTAHYHSGLGEVYSTLGRMEEAIACYRQALALRPDFAEVYNNLGLALQAQGTLDEALRCYELALAIKPDYAEASSNRGNILQLQGRLDEAILCYRQALTLSPDIAETWSNFGTALAANGRLDEASDCFQRALTLNPEMAEACNNLGSVLKDLKTLDEALAAFRLALEIWPEMAGVHGNIGNILKEQGRLDEALVFYRRAISLAPENPVFHSNYLLMLNMHPGFEAKALYEEHRDWARHHEQPRRQFIRPHSNSPDPDRRLRIGYVSPDLREHPVGLFLLPLLEQHDHTQFEITCYADVPKPDAVTERLSIHADRWRMTAGLSEGQLAEQIRDDSIDILVDLTLHTDSNRLPVFARKPAPVQMTYLAYPGTSGLDTMDYRLTDPYLDPSVEGDACYSEASVTLPDSYWCYATPTEAPNVGSLPARTAGHITFGSLSALCKVNERVLSVWSRLLRTVSDSRLLIHARAGSHRAHLQETMAKEGIEPDRINFIGFVPLAEYYAHYGRIDIALDTFPYAGGTTTCDALWMGVPVVSLVGQTAVGRGGLSILTNLGLPELAAHTEDEYVRLATDLAADLPRLTQLRATMRDRMLASPLMDAPRFARNIEDAYRSMWREYCNKINIRK